MKKKYLLDANDAFKKMVFGWLNMGLRNLHVIPMITYEVTDERVWAPADWRLYAQLFGIQPCCVLAKESQFTNGGRHDYFAMLLQENPRILPATADIFVDPDTGLGDGRETHINAAEVAALLRDRDRVVIIYQHANRNQKQIANDLQRRRGNINAALGGQAHTFTFGIRTTSICLYFFSLNESRLKKLKEICQQQFGSMKSTRVFDGVKLLDKR